eukprot:CAMPEP_0175123582 /NCGR_PEP_ID=MMETSP0087-20121206/2323_1 /TAXON_ID=136419 /ORGANISM="Unknown Unknown, Strain D1" /LENGTH=226 /DNA_ID=CAMNT_0016405289 /DNA_START=210 /DNA_END=890 /DNA_ORIENTATION=-
MTPAEQAADNYATSLQKQDTACYHTRYKGVCWDLAACAVSRGASLNNPVPWDCSRTLNGTRPPYGLSGADALFDDINGGFSDDYKDRPECYVWGVEISPPSGSWTSIWNSTASNKSAVATATFQSVGVQPGDILQFDNYWAKCGDDYWESTGNGPHTAVIADVGAQDLTVCHQNWNNVSSTACGYTFFGWFTACKLKWLYHYDALKIYRPARGTQQKSGPCDSCIA